MNGQSLEVEIDEALEIFWTLGEQGERDKEVFKEKVKEEMEKASTSHRKQFRHGYQERISEKILEALIHRGLAEESVGEVKLTPQGENEAKKVARRHRLAERLLVDTLEMREEEFEKPACEFEHLLSDEITDSICTLLGHPRECPHELPIPRGKCCIKGKDMVKQAVIPLSDAPLGEELKVAYVSTRHHTRLHRLLSYDIGPGAKIKLHQKKPVFVIRAGETDVAVEGDVAEDIFVKRV